MSPQEQEMFQKLLNLVEAQQGEIDRLKRQAEAHEALGAKHEALLERLRIGAAEFRTRLDNLEADRRGDDVVSSGPLAIDLHPDTID